MDDNDNEVRFESVTITKIEQTGYYFGRPCGDHLVIRIYGSDAAGNDYEDVIPVMLQDGKPWEFTRGNEREVTEDDQRECVKRIQEIFPTLGVEFTGESIRKFLAALAAGGVTANAKIDGKTYTDKEGKDHANMHLCKPGKAFATDWLDNLGKAVAKTAPKMPPKTAPKKTAAKPKPPAPKMPPKPAKTVDQLREEALAAYEKTRTDDPSGERYYERAAEIVGKDVYSWESWDAADWTKIVEAFEMPF